MMNNRMEKYGDSHKRQSSLAIWAAMLAVYIVWGSTYLAIRFAVETMPPFLMAATRFLVPGAILYIWRRLQGDPPPTKTEWRSAAIVGTFLLVGGNGMVVWAEQRVVSGVAALLVGSAPLWMVLIDSLRPQGRRPGGWAWLGVLAGFAGIVLLVGPGQVSGGNGGVDPLGAAALTLAALSWAVGSLYSRGARLPASPLLGTGMEMLAGGVGLVLVGTLTGDWGRLDLAGISARSIWGLLYLIFFGSLVGFAAYTWLLRTAPTTLVSTYAYVNPVVAIFMGNWLAAEPLTPRILVATAIIAGSVALITLARPAAPQRELVEVAAAARSAGSSGDD
jgi:drug/metabolite transporter (DMT)-like permease